MHDRKVTTNFDQLKESQILLLAHYLLIIHDFQVALKTEFTTEELKNLNNFISVVTRCGSWTLQYKKQLGRVSLTSLPFME